MNSSAKLENIKTTLTGPGAPRAMLVTMGRKGLQSVAVDEGESVLNIERDLIDRLDNYPHSDEWLAMLRDYCTGRLAARAEAGATGGISMPRPGGWDIVHVVLN